MKKYGAILLVLLLLLPAFSLQAFATTTENGCKTLHADRALVEEGYTGTAKAVILYELNTQTLVYAHNPDASVNPTGLVKLMTALIALEEGNLNDVVTVKQSVLNMVSSGAKRIGLKANDQLTVKDLLYCMMVSSANDAAVVLADHMAGSQKAFVEKMNTRAATLGCTNTFFADVNGLEDDRQYATARELAIITQEALKNPQFEELFGAVNYQLPETVSCTRDLTTTNSMMNLESSQYDARVTGGKPSAAGSSDRSMICTAESEEKRYLCVVISVSDKKSNYAGTFKEVRNLLNYGFDGFEIQQVMGTEQPFGLYTVSGGENDVVVGPDEALYALLPTAFEPAKLRFEDVPDVQALHAPLTAGAAVGVLRIYYDEIIIGQVNMLSRHAVATAGENIQAPDSSGSNDGVFGRILKWTGIILLIVLIVTSAVLLILRRINLSRYQKVRRRHAGTTERGEE